MSSKISTEHTAIMCDCKTCNKQISINAIICPNCGTNDPFYFEEVKRVTRENVYKFIISEGFLILAAIFSYNHIHDFLLFILVGVLGFLIWYMWARIHEKYEEAFYEKIVKNRENSTNFLIWRDYVWKFSRSFIERVTFLFDS